MAEHPPETVVRNIEEIVRSEEEMSLRRGLGERLGDLVGSTAGTLPFILFQIAVVLAWVVANAGVIPGIPVFDPFPYSLLGSLMSLEGVLLACFVLLKQSHESRLSERRSHLNLQVNLLVEKEGTKLIQMLERQNTAEGKAAIVTDEETRELRKVTAVGHLAEELDRRLERGEG